MAGKSSARRSVANPKHWATLFLALTCFYGNTVGARTGAQTDPAQQKTVSSEGISSEKRLLEVYQLMAQGEPHQALEMVEKLVHDVPNFQLAQLVYGDLLSARTRTLKSMGDVPAVSANAGAIALAELKEESQRRVQAANERPSEGTVPSQFLKLSAQTRTAIAVDATKSRLYLFTNTPSGLQLTADYYVSVGKAGTIKSQEGDQRTP
jgi:hypothetical protein